jgi:peptide/nickel transport system substrate-binding protein
METEFPTVEDFYNELYDVYDGDVRQYFSIEGYGRLDIMELVQNELVSAWAAEDKDWKGAVSSISGLERISNRAVTITLEQCDDATLRTLCDVYVAPLHFYGDESLYDYEGNSFGFTKGNLNALRESKRTSLGGGEFLYRETLGKTVYLDTNANYWLGQAEVPEAILTIE